MLKCVLSPIFTKAYRSDLKAQVLISNSQIPGILPTPPPNIVVQEMYVSGLRPSPFSFLPLQYLCLQGASCSPTKTHLDILSKVQLFSKSLSRATHLPVCPPPNRVHPTFMKTDPRKDLGMPWKPHICISPRNSGALCTQRKVQNTNHRTCWFLLTHGDRHGFWKGWGSPYPGVRVGLLHGHSS